MSGRGGGQVFTFQNTQFPSSRVGLFLVFAQAVGAPPPSPQFMTTPRFETKQRRSHIVFTAVLSRRGLLQAEWAVAWKIISKQLQALTQRAPVTPGLLSKLLTAAHMTGTDASLTGSCGKYNCSLRKDKTTGRAKIHHPLLAEAEIAQLKCNKSNKNSPFSFPFCMTQQSWDALKRTKVQAFLWNLTGPWHLLLLYCQIWYTTHRKMNSESNISSRRAGYCVWFRPTSGREVMTLSTKTV